ncbi:hypothetical protein Pla8534_29980 [Lignipirellula cremea]|uniref:Uncharacterized protein n=2 Tax=Lignipirellula cremea TaxID=2528010 RepID=A0A518DTL9_9BACT|nr:hypothetical protein Pla8534_29980 [Lignipirellula cremea]
MLFNSIFANIGSLADDQKRQLKELHGSGLSHSEQNDIDEKNLEKLKKAIDDAIEKAIGFERRRAEYLRGRREIAPKEFAEAAGDDRGVWWGNQFKLLQQYAGMPPSIVVDLIQACAEIWADLIIEAGNAEPPENEAEPIQTVAHSVDFRSLQWFGTPYTFTANQAPVVRLLYEHWKTGTPEVGDETLLSAVDPEAPPARIDTLFRDHPAWGVMIVRGSTKGTRRLAKPE